MLVKNPNAPIALDCWAPGPSSYVQARAVIQDEVSKSSLPERLRKPAEKALYARIADHSNDNYYHFDELMQSQDEKLQARIAADETFRERTLGYGTHGELVTFLRDYPLLRSIEIARLTHVNNWETRADIDDVVRADLDTMSGLETVEASDDSHYKIKGLIQDDAHMPVVERKRIVRSHFGGSVFTVVRNSLLIDMADAGLPTKLRHSIEEQQLQVRKARDYNYDAHSKGLKKLLEDHMIERDPENKPTWAIPLLATYYSALDTEFIQGNPAPVDANQR